MNYIWTLLVLNPYIITDNIIKEFFHLSTTIINTILLGPCRIICVKVSVCLKSLLHWVHAYERHAIELKLKYINATTAQKYVCITEANTRVINLKK